MSRPACWLGSFASSSEHTEQFLKNKTFMTAAVSSLIFVERLVAKRPATSAKAAEAVLESEEKYLDLCAQSCKKCSESKLPRKQPLERDVHIA